MMEAVSRYILSVIAAAFVVGILSSFVDKKGSMGSIIRLIGGLFLTFTIISPLIKMDFSSLADFFAEYEAAGESMAASGEILAEDEYRTIIKGQVEAYILDKADALGAVLTVEVTLGDDAVPAEAVLHGKVSPYAKSKLQQIMEEELGIAKEDQLWIG